MTSDNFFKKLARVFSQPEVFIPLAIFGAAGGLSSVGGASSSAFLSGAGVGSSAAATIAAASLTSAVGSGISAFTSPSIDQEGVVSSTRADAQTKQDQAVATAEPVETISEQAKRSRRLRSKTLSREFGELTLGTPALTGG